MVNACRLYLKVTMLSEILDANGEYIQQWAMHGTQQNETAMEYQYQPRPPPRAWKTWRDAIHATYLDKHLTADSCTLYRTIGPTPHQHNTATLASMNTYDGHADEGTHRSLTTCIQTSSR